MRLLMFLCMEKILRFTCAIVMALAVCSCTSGRGGSGRRIPAVEVFSVDSASLSAIPSEFTGVADGSYSTVLSFSVSGNIEKIFIKEGQRVSSGDLLAVLDKRTAENAFSAAKASYDRAEDGYRRAKEVYEKGSMPEVKWIEVSSQRDQAAALFDIARKNLEDCSLYSPVDGVVSSVLVEQGMNVPAFRPVIELIDPDAVEIEIKVPENEISELSIGETAEVEVPAVGKSGIVAEVISKGVSADPLSHSYKVRLSMPVSDGIMPGMTCRVVFSGNLCGREAFVLPGKSVSVSNDGRRYVWVVVDGRARRKYIDVAGMTSSGVLVSSGVECGDAVVSEGMTKISEGMEVSVVK